MLRVKSASNEEAAIEQAKLEVTARLAEFAVATRLAEIPVPVRDQARTAIADSIATLIASLQEPSVRLLREVVTRESGRGSSTVIGCDLRLAPTAAAFINAATAHALDYDSISLVVSGFVSTPLLFPLLALAEERDLSGSSLLEAFIVGWEVEAAVARGVGVAHYAGGWHATSTLGHLGAAVACAKLLGFDVDAMRRALGFAATDAAGLRTIIGNMTNLYHLGKAARCGVLGALLIERGFTAHEAALEADWGFCNAFNGAGQYDLARMLDGIGAPYDLVDPGLVIKLYPCCGLIHSALDGVLDLLREHGLDAARVRRARIAVHDLVMKTMDRPWPGTSYEAKFCAPFCVAVALREGAVELAHFSEAAIRDPQIHALMQRVDVAVHPELTGYDSFLEREFSDVALDLDDGRTVECRIWRLANRGSKGRPASRAELERKFSSCTTQYARSDRVAHALDKVARIEQLASVRELTAALA